MDDPQTAKTQTLCVCNMKIHGLRKKGSKRLKVLNECLSFNLTILQFPSLKVNTIMAGGPGSKLLRDNT